MERLKKNYVFKAMLACLVLLLVIMLAACGSNDPIQNDQEESQGSDSNEKITLKISHFLPPVHYYNDIIQSFVDEVEDLTDGRITFEVYPAAALGTAESHYDMAATGVADITVSLQSYTKGKFPLSSVVELPFISSSAQVGTEILFDLYNKFPEIQEEYSDTKVLWLFQNDAEYIYTTKKAVKTLDDMEGLRIRTASDMTSKVVRLLGGSPMFMPMPDVYDSAQRGVIDGSTGPLSAMESFRLSDVMGNVTEGPFTITNFFVVMNNAAWKKLSVEDQKIIDGLTEKYRKISSTSYDEAGERGRKLAVDAGIQFHKLSEEENQKFKDALTDVYQDWVNEMKSKGLPGDEVLKEAQRLSEEYQS